MQSLPLHKTKQKRKIKKCLILSVMKWDRTDCCTYCTSACVIYGLISALLRTNSCNSSICSTTFCSSFVAELSSFCKGLTVFKQILSPVKNFHVILGNLLQSSLFAIQSWFCLPLAGKQVYLQHNLQLEDVSHSRHLKSLFCLTC